MGFCNTDITAGVKPKPYDEIRKHCLPPPGRGTEGVGFCNTNITAGVKPQPYEKTDSEGLVPLSNYVSLHVNTNGKAVSMPRRAGTSI